MQLTLPWVMWKGKMVQSSHTKGIKDCILFKSHSPHPSRIGGMRSSQGACKNQ